MKGYLKTRGWRFPLQGGPLHGTELRLPGYNPKNELKPEAMLELIESDDLAEIVWRDDLWNIKYRYVREPLLGETVKVNGEEYQKYVYVHDGEAA